MVDKKAQIDNDCTEKVRDSKVKIHDRGTGKSAILLNLERTQIRRIRMDGCLSPAGAIAADFLVSKPKAVDVIVELKGKNVEQIESTWMFWSKHAEHEEGQLIGAWVICTEYPRASTKVARYRESFRARGVILLFSTRNGEERAFSEFTHKRP